MCVAKVCETLGMTIRYESGRPFHIKKRSLGLHYQSLVMTTQLCRSVSLLKQKRFLKALEEESLMLITRKWIMHQDTDPKLILILPKNG